MNQHTLKVFNIRDVPNKIYRQLLKLNLGHEGIMRECLEYVRDPAAHPVYDWGRRCSFWNLAAGEKIVSPSRAWVVVDTLTGGQVRAWSLVIPVVTTDYISCEQNSAWEAHFYVVPKYRKQGRAQALMDCIMSRTRKNILVGSHDKASSAFFSSAQQRYSRLKVR